MVMHLPTYLPTNQPKNNLPTNQPTYSLHGHGMHRQDANQVVDSKHQDGDELDLPKGPLFLRMTNLLGTKGAHVRRSADRVSTGGWLVSVCM